MRWTAWIACVGLVATANASPLRPRAATDAYPIDALREFLAGVRGDRVGDALGAITGYRESIRLSRQPNSYYNLAELLLRLGDPSGAIENLEKYVELAPKAPDRAEIERLIRELRAAPPEVTVGGSVMSDDGGEVDAIVLVDAVVVGHSPVTVHPSVGDHVFERITASTYALEEGHAAAGWRSYVDITGVKGARGNVIITGMPHHDQWHEGSTSFVAGHRFPLPKGHYTIGPGASFCKPLSFEVTSTSEVTYVHVDGATSLRHDCFPVTGVIVHSLGIGPP